jgi:hypothetical protein
MAEPDREQTKGLDTGKSNSKEMLSVLTLSQHTLAVKPSSGQHFFITPSPIGA